MSERIKKNQKLEADEMATAKCVVLGGNNSGKAELFCSLNDDRDSSEDSTSVTRKIGGVLTTLYLWNVYTGRLNPGRAQLRFAKSDLVVVCFSLHNRQSFEDIRQWVFPVLEENSFLPVILLGINSREESTTSREVSKQEIDDLLGEITTSSSDGVGCGKYIECDLHRPDLTDQLFHEFMRFHASALPKKGKISNNYRNNYQITTTTTNVIIDVPTTWNTFPSDESDSSISSSSAVSSMSTLTEHSVESLIREYRKNQQNKNKSTGVVIHTKTIIDNDDGYNTKDHDIRSGESIRSYFEIEVGPGDEVAIIHKKQRNEERGLYHYHHHNHHHRHHHRHGAHPRRRSFSFAQLIAAYWNTPPAISA
jgi:hypothetical protein